MEKAQALGAASQALGAASQNAAAEIAVARRVAFRPSALTASPVRMRAYACVHVDFRASAIPGVISVSGMPPKRVRTAYKPILGLWVGYPTCPHRKRLKTALIAP